MHKYYKSSEEMPWVEREIPGYRYKTLGYHEKLAMVMCQSDAGFEVGLHHHPDEECIYYLKGSSEIQVGEEKFVVKAGEYVYIPADMPHSVKMLEDAEFIGACSPPKPVYKPHDA